MKMKAIKKIAVLLALTATVAFAGDNNGLSFLKLPVDARSAAMGEASTALFGDASAAFRNPAALTANGSRSFMLMHNAYLADIAQEFAAFQFLTGKKHSAALSLNIMDIPGIEIRGTRPTESPDGKTDAINFAFGLSYAYRYNDLWSLGTTVKYLFEKYYMESAAGWAVDLGVVRHDALLTGLDWAFVVQNIGRMNPLKTERTPLPTILRSGIQYTLHPGWHMLSSVLVAADVQHVLDESTYVHLGFELPLIHAFNLRAGTILLGEKVRYSFGFGLTYKNYQVNYAFSPYPYDLGNSHRFSLSWLF